MRLKFTKMQGAGNDFVVLDGTHGAIELTNEQVRLLGDRRFGVGADQILVVERSDTPGVDFRYRIFNNSGDEVEHCGNGARCFVRYVHDHGLTSKDRIRVETRSGIIEPRLRPDGEVTVDMGSPVFEAGRIPFRAPRPGLVHEIEAGGERVRIAALSMGNPHAVQVVPDVDAAPVRTQGPLIEHHPLFPQRVNAGYMQVQDRHALRLRVWERGTGETLACGTGACAAVVAGVLQGLLESPVKVSTRGGALTIEWAGNDNNRNAPVFMTGPAVAVFDGELEIDGR